MTSILKQRAAPQEPTLAEIEDALAFNVQVIRRYGEYSHAYPRCHEEINELLDEWEELRRIEGLTTPVAPPVE